MKIITLMEDTVNSDNIPKLINIKAEHGLSFYIETKKHKLLVDTGASPITLENALELGVALKNVDTIVISHGHYDHTGGLLECVKMCPNADIYMQKTAGRDYYHGDRYIGIDKKILDLSKLHLIEGSYKIDEEIEIFSEISGRRNWPQSNLILSEKINGENVQDSFVHEQCLVINDEKGKILVSGCAHNGILNILDRFKELYKTSPLAVFSGFHMMKKTDYTEEEIKTIEETARELCDYETTFYTGHCTGQKAVDILKNTMKEKLVQIYAGYSTKI